MTRGLILLATFFVLVATLVIAWQFRFERDPSFPVYRLADLRQGAPVTPGAEWTGSELSTKLKLQVSAANPRVIVRLGFPEMEEISFLHLRYRVAASHLQPGREVWDDGRFIIEWENLDSSEPETDPFGAVRHDMITGDLERVMRPSRGKGIPILRIEHLGCDGYLEFLNFQAVVVRESLVWVYGSWFLVIAWTAWVVAWIRWMGVASWWRPLVAASVCSVMAICFVIPGPWKMIHTILFPFQIGLKSENMQVVTYKPTKLLNLENQTKEVGENLKSKGRIVSGGSFILQIKQYARYARPLLHGMMLFGPALLIAFLVGRNPALFLTTLLSFAIEAAQVAFGYGFDWIDVLDLVWNALGIFAALCVYQRLLKRISPVLGKWIY